MREDGQRASAGLVLILAWLFTLTASAQQPSRWVLNAVLASDYRRHGLSQIDSGAAVQLGVDYSHHSGFFVGGSLNDIDRGRRFGSLQADGYVGFGWNLPAWDANVALHRYGYPDAIADYDYNELSASGVFRDRFIASVSYTDELAARWGAALDAEIGWIWPLREDVEVSATIGRFRAEGLGDARYTHWNLGASKIIRRFGVDLRYYGSSLSETLVIGDPAPRWVVSLSYALAGPR
jgi:uncharacterized protein (TIGR02001 family)